jgi:hypothetical protein
VKRLAASLLAAGMVTLSAGVLPIPAAAATAAGHWAALAISGMTPQVATAGTGVVHVTGTITNTSDRPIDDVRVQLRVGEAVRDDADVSAGLAGTAVTDHGTPFTQVSGALGPGQSAPLTVTVPVAGAEGLEVTEPGVYPLLVNVNGVPAYGGQTRLAMVSLLLPVLAPGGSGGLAPAGPNPAQLTLLWPLVDTRPRLIGTAGSGQPILSDDELAGSLATGGRLYGLLHAALDADQAGRSELNSMCFVIDPDLVATVAGMAHGYQVRSGSGTTAGRGQSAAAAWLTDLRRLLSGRCVLALPYADPDLTALNRAGGTDLTKLAVTGAAQQLRTALGVAVTPLTGVAWPAGGTTDQPTAAALAADGDQTLLVNPDSLRPGGPSPVRPLSGITGGKAIGTDNLVSAALTQLAPPAAEASGVGPSAATPADEPAIATQNGTAALLYRTMVAPTPGRTVLIAPPRRWTAPQAQLTAFLGTVQQVLDNHYATPTGLDALVARPAAGAPAALAYLPEVAATEVAAPVIAAVLAEDGQQQQVEQALHADPTDPTLTPATLIDPLRYQLLRAGSNAWRRGGSAGARAVLTAVGANLAAVTGAVQPVPPPQAISWASQNSQLPLTVHNELPVDVNVTVNLAMEEGVRPSPVLTELVPARSSVTKFVKAKVNRSGRFTVQASLSTPSGIALGSPARLELVSSTYGTIIVVVTGIAFGALVLLAARRIYRRIRAARAAAAES